MPASRAEANPQNGMQKRGNLMLVASHKTPLDEFLTSMGIYSQTNVDRCRDISVSSDLSSL